MVEVGTFLSGSALQWLGADDNFTLIVLDGWTAAAGAWVGKTIQEPPSWVADPLALVPIRDTLAKHSIMSVALHNLLAHKHRVVPIQMMAANGY